MELIVPSRRCLADVLLEESPRIAGIKETTPETILRDFKMSYDWSRDLLGDASTELDRLIAVPENASDKSCVLDAVDLRLHELLLEVGLRSLSELASIVSISESMARRRVDALRERGCLRFATFWNPTCSGMT